MDPLRFNHSVPKDLGIFPCGICGKIFTEAVRLRNHEAQHAASSGLHSGGASTVYKSGGVNNCGDSSVSVGGPTPTSQAQPGVLENGLTLHSGVDADRKRQRTRRRLVGCDICGKVFRSVCDLNRHKLSHTGEKPYACPVCSLRFKRKDRMSYHVRSHDVSGGKPYVCQRCGNGFSRPDHLTGHIKHVHSSERPHKCQICNASFATRDRLRSHLACHEDKIPCQVCGKLLRAAYMTDHLKKHSEGPHNYGGTCNKDGQEDSEKGPHQDSESSYASFGKLSDGGNRKSQRKAKEDGIGVLACSGSGGPSAGASKRKVDPGKKHPCADCGQAFRSKSCLNKHVQRVHSGGAQEGLAVTDTTLGGLPPPSLGSPFSPQRNMSLLESFGFQVVQSAFASSLADSEAGHSGMSMGGK